MIAVAIISVLSVFVGYVFAFKLGGLVAILAIVGLIWYMNSWHVRKYEIGAIAIMVPCVSGIIGLMLGGMANILTGMSPVAWSSVWHWLTTPGL